LSSSSGTPSWHDFVRPEFLGLEPDEVPHKLPILGLTVARWLLENGLAWAEREEATHVAFPFTMLYPVEKSYFGMQNHEHWLETP
jgi:hypothetical protein